MASVKFTYKNDEERIIDNIQNLAMHPPYWVVQYDDVREFLNFDMVRSAIVEGEEELMQAAQVKKTNVPNPEQLAKDLGLD